MTVTLKGKICLRCSNDACGYAQSLSPAAAGSLTASPSCDKCQSPMVICKAAFDAKEKSA